MGTMAMPAQHETALLRANEIRLNIAQIRRDAQAAANRREGMRTMADAIENDAPDIGRARVFHLLTGCRRIGKRQAGAIVASLGVRSPERRLCELSERQRTELLAILRNG